MASQPAVTGHIRRLEASLETTPFIRLANGVSLTERGAHLRERVQDVLAELEEIWRELDRTREVNGTLTLAASTTVARYFCAEDFIRFHHYHPAAALHLIVGNTEEVLDHLRQQRSGLVLSRKIVYEINQRLTFRSGLDRNPSDDARAGSDGSNSSCTLKLMVQSTKTLFNSVGERVERSCRFVIIV